MAYFDTKTLEWKSGSPERQELPIKNRGIFTPACGEIEGWGFLIESIESAVEKLWYGHYSRAGFGRLGPQPYNAFIEAEILSGTEAVIKYSHNPCNGEPSEIIEDKIIIMPGRIWMGHPGNAAHKTPIKLNLSRAEGQIFDHLKTHGQTHLNELVNIMHTTYGKTEAAYYKQISLSVKQGALINNNDAISINYDVAELY